jgi:hypothetical protein
MTESVFDLICETIIEDLRLCSAARKKRRTRWARSKRRIDFLRTKEEHRWCQLDPDEVMPSSSQASIEDEDGLEATVDQAIAACDGNMRSTIRALIVANEYLENEVSELMKAISHAYARGRFQTYSG